MHVLLWSWLLNVSVLIGYSRGIGRISWVSESNVTDRDVLLQVTGKLQRSGQLQGQTRKPVVMMRFLATLKTWKQVCTS